VGEEVNKEHCKNGTEQIKFGYIQLTGWRGQREVGGSEIRSTGKMEKSI
jgi:hypothetical protein